MNVNYWHCKFHDYDESWDGESELRIYGCTHPDMGGSCPHDNKWCDATVECKFAEVKEKK